MKVTYDPQADAAYIYLDEAAPFGAALTYPCDPSVGQINLDFDLEGRLIGIEVLDASKKLAGQLLKDAHPPS